MQQKPLNPKLETYLEGLSNMFNLDSVILFGSRSRKEHLDVSDYDLLIIGDFKVDFLERLRIVGHVKPWGIHIDAIPVTPTEFENMLLKYDPIALEAASTGMPLISGPSFKRAQKIYQYYKKNGLKRGKFSWKLPIDSRGKLVSFPARA